MSTKLIEESHLRTLVEYALCYEALLYEDVEKWSHYYDALESAKVIKWNEEKEKYEYDNYRVDELIRMYSLDSLIDLISLMDHKIDIYDRKDSEFADGVKCALIYIKTKLKEIIGEG